MTYYQWKTTDPRDYDESPECLCEEAELDWEGRFRCPCCGRAWWATREELTRDRQRHVAHDAWYRAEERREFLRKLTWWVRWPVFRLLEKVWPRRSLVVLDDDEIPF